MPKIVGFIGGDLTPAEPRFAWTPTIMTGLASYALLWLASTLPGRSLVPNKRRPLLPEYSSKVLARINEATRAARAHERANPVPAAAAAAFAVLPPGRYSFDTDRGLVRRYKAKTTLRGAVQSTSKAASGSDHPHVLVDTLGERVGNDYLPAAPVVVRAFRADGYPTFMVEDDLGITLPPMLPKEVRDANRLAQAAAREARDADKMTLALTRAENAAKRAAEREEKAAKAAALRIQKAADRAATAQRQEALALLAPKSKTSRGMAGPTRKMLSTDTSMETPPPAPVVLKMPAEVTPAMLKERRKVLRELAGQMTAEEALKKHEEKLLRSLPKSSPVAPAPAAVKVGYLIGYLKGKARIIDVDGNYHLVDEAIFKSGGIEPKSMFVRHGKTGVAPAPAGATLTWSQEMALREARGMKTNGPRWGNRAAGLLIVARDTGRVLLTLRSADVVEPHTWGLPGGKCEGAEGTRSCALREFQEETGYGLPIVVASPPLHVYREPDFEFHNFLGFVDSEFEPELDWENEDFGWFALNELPRRLHFGVRELFGVAGRDIQSMIAQA